MTVSLLTLSQRMIESFCFEVMKKAQPHALIMDEDGGPNKAMRKMLAQRWKQLPEEKQLTLRASRARSGVKCVICGTIGYYMENCPNGCTSPPGTPDSWASTPPGTPPKSPMGLGILWGDSFSKSGEPSSAARYDYKKKVDVNTVRPQALQEEKRLRDLDAKVGTFAFFAEAEEGYADSYSQMTLHQVMRRLMRLLERQLNKNTAELEAKFDTTLLHPPRQKVGATFYPPELKKIKEYRDYFINKEQKKGNKKAYQNQSSVRCADDLDPLYRGSNTSDDFLYKVNPNAGASMHSKNTWKSVLSQSDELASSDPAMAKKQAKVQELFRNQSKWIKLQQTGMSQRNDRFEHLVNILKDEINNEHAREATLLETSKHGLKPMQMKLYQERLDSVDKIMSCLHSYNFTSGLDEADFLLFCFDRWKQTLHSKLYGKNLHIPQKYTNVTDNLNATGEGSQHSMSSSTVGFLKPDKSKPNAGSGLDYNRMISAANPYAQDLAFLGYMKKKSHNLRVKAMAGSGIEVTDDSSQGSKACALQRQNTKDSDDAQALIDSADDALDSLTDDLGNPVRASKRTPLTEQAHKPGVSDRKGSSVGGLHLQRSSASAGTGSFDSSMNSIPEGRELVTLGAEQDGVSLMNSLGGESSVFETGRQRLSKSAQKASTMSGSTLRRKRHPREIDADNIEKAKGAFKRAGLKGNIRKGVDQDLAYLAPTLIPVPAAFQADGSNPMISHTAENILFQVKKNMILGDIGYTPQTMVPLYVRNTLIEKNGTTPGGDQSYDVMSTDRRYSHYVGRALNRFEPGETKLKMEDSFGGINEEILRSSLSNPDRQMKLMTSALAKNLQTKDAGPRRPTKRELQQQAELERVEQAKREHRQVRRLIHEEVEKAKGLPLTKSLVRMAFKDPLPSLASLAYLDDD